jgi:hypothetical protein
MYILVWSNPDGFYIVRKIRPTDIIQRDGRGLRFGNENDLLKIFRHVTKDTFVLY